MPETSRSFQSVSLNVFSSAAFCGSVVAGLKSAAARRTFCTPRLVPVFTQSWAESNEEQRQQMQIRNVHCKRRWELPSRCRMIDGAGSSIRLEKNSTRYDNIVSRYVLLGNNLSVGRAVLIHLLP